MRIGITVTSKEMMRKELLGRGLAVDDDVLEEYDKLETIDAIEEAFQELGHETWRLWWGETLIQELSHKKHWLDLVFNISEGFGGRSREAQVPALLEMLGIPFVGSDAMAMAVSLDKHAAKALVRTTGVSVAKGFLVRSENDCTDSTLAQMRLAHGLTYPLIVKPAYEGSSKGIRQDSLANTNDRDLADKVRSVLFKYAQPVLVEEFIWGREVTVAVVGDPPHVLGVMEIRLRSNDPFAIYSLESKRNWKEDVKYLCQPDLPEGILKKLHTEAISAFEALGCKDMARVDFRLRGTNLEPVFLEINPLPGLNSDSSDLCLMAAGLGISYRDLLKAITGGAVARTLSQSKNNGGPRATLPRS